MKGTPAALAFALAAVVLASSAALPPFSHAAPEPRPQPKVDKVEVLKSARKMNLLAGGRIVAQYDIDLGFDPVGHKQEAGDGKTPEGKYTISGRNPESRYFLSLRVSYPNAEDRRKARALGVDPGGDIMVHGLPNGLPAGFEGMMRKDWTLGCIAVRSNKFMTEIYGRVADGTPIEIKP